MFTDKVIIVTGGSNGMGKYMAKKFVAEGAQVVITGRDLDRLKAAQEEIGCVGAKIASYGVNPDEAIVVDVSFAYTSDADEHKCGKMGKGSGRIGCR